MKKITLVLAIAFLPLITFSQSMFDKYEDMEDVGVVVVNKAMINLVGQLGELSDDADAKEFMEAAQGINGIKVFITEDKGISTEMAATVKKYLKSSSLEELMRVKDKDVNVKFYIKNGKKKDHVSELLMFVSGMKNLDVDVNGRKFETVLVSMTGDIDLNKIGSITNKMNLPNDLKKVDKGE
jgi:hypothetical protein